MRIRQLASLLAVNLLAGACAAAPPVAEFTDADREAIARVTADAVTIANTSADWHAYTELYYAADAAVHMEGSPTLHGRPAIVEVMQQFTGMHELRIHPVTMDGSGDMAYVFGEASYVPAEATTMEHYRYLEVWQRQADGSWKVVQDIGHPIVPEEGLQAP